MVWLTYVACGLAAAAMFCCGHEESELADTSSSVTPEVSAVPNPPSAPCDRHRQWAPLVQLNTIRASALDSDNIEFEPQPHVWAEPVGPPNGRLFVFIPGTDPGYREGEQTEGGPLFYRELLRTAAAGGFRTIGLNYINDIPINVVCAGLPDCNELARQEVITGEDTWSWPPDDPEFDERNVEVDPPNSILGRLVRLLEHLRWDEFLVDGAPRWDRIVFAGHSQGGGHAALLGKYHRIDRAMMFDATESAPWTIRSEQAFETPAARYYGFTSILDQPIYRANVQGWAQMEMPEPLVWVNQAGLLPPSVHQLRTSREARDGNEHGTTSLDDSVPLDENNEILFRDAWCHMMGP
ncbi:MAG: hypothetical protein AAFN74_16725 [Myxococcota bacterium]